MSEMYFEWDKAKDTLNQQKHGISFDKAQYAFLDPNRVIAIDQKHSNDETRYYCFGRTEDGILTVRFTTRKNIIRIIGAGFWRKGKVIYEQKNNC